jgi:hypothetical protein
MSRETGGPAGLPVSFLVGERREENSKLIQKSVERTRISCLVSHPAVDYSDYIEISSNRDEG